MSYILDALKKSEAERQQRHAPGVASVPERARRRATPVWIWILAALLLVNAAALGVLVLRPATPATPAATNTVPPAELPPPSAATGGEPTLNDIATGSRAARQAPATSEAGPVDADAPPPATSDESTRRSAGPEPAAQPARQPVPDTSTPPAATPSYLELKARGTLQLPDLHLDIHVFSQVASERFVFINMQKYREGDRLADGPEVSAIRDDGVLLKHRGTSFLLPRE